LGKKRDEAPALYAEGLFGLQGERELFLQMGEPDHEAKNCQANMI
jgi:hypothetical protein